MNKEIVIEKLSDILLSIVKNNVDITFKQQMEILKYLNNNIYDNSLENVDLEKVISKTLINYLISTKIKVVNKQVNDILDY